MATSISSPRTPKTPRRVSFPSRSDEFPRFITVGSMGRSSSLRHVSYGESDVPDAAVEAAEHASKAALEEIERDQVFSKFLHEDFNATAFASQALGSGSAVALTRKLSEGIVLLERQLRSEVVLRHDELLQQLSSLRDTEAALSVVRACVDSLQASVQSVRSEIAEPYKQIKLKTRQLAGLHDSMEVLRSVAKILKQIKRLKDHMAPGTQKVELAKAAQLYSEIDSLRKEGDLEGVDVVEAEIFWLQEVGQQIRTEAMKSLEQGMESLNQAEVGSVLQVYFNMGELRGTVEVLLNRYKVQATKAVGAALDMKAISASMGSGTVGGPGGVSRSGTPALGSGPRARDALWQRLQTCTDSLHGILMATWHLQRVLAKKRDPISHVVFLDEVVQPGEQMLTEKVWDSLVRAFTSQLKAAFTASSFVKETFVSGYPKLLGAVEGLLERLGRDTEVKGVQPAVKPDDQMQLIAALEPFQSAYLGQSLTRMTELVNGLLPAGSRGPIPPVESVSRFVARLQDEVEAVKSNTRLTLLVLKGVGKALQLLAERAEYQVNLSPDARQVVGPATAAEQRNAALCVFLQELHVRMVIMLVILPPGGEEVVESGLNAIHSVASNTITPLFKAMVERIESCLLLMHEENFGSSESDISGSSSKYLEESVKAMAHFRSEFLSKLVPNLPQNSPPGEEPICIGLTRRMASRVLLFFVRHVALIRPLSEAGKLRMARDMGELEFSVGQYFFPVEQLGAPYRALRAFRPLLFLDTSQILSSSLLQDIPPSAIIHHLFSRSPPDLESPMKRNQLTPARYSLWLDRHSEEDAWKEVKGSLDSYAHKIRARGDKEFSPLYPLVLQLGQTLIENTVQFEKGR